MAFSRGIHTVHVHMLDCVQLQYSQNNIHALPARLGTFIWSLQNRSSRHAHTITYWLDSSKSTLIAHLSCNKFSACILCCVVLQKGVFFSDLDSTDTRKYFKTFVSKWNSGRLKSVSFYCEHVVVKLLYSSIW